MSGRSILLVMAFAASVAGCSSEPVDDGWVGETARIGDTTVVRTLSGSVWAEPPALVEELRIGVLDGAPEYLFGDVFRMAEDRDGGVYVLDRQGPSLRHFDGEGTYVRTLGGEGEGPGEYTWLSLGMAVDPAGTLFMDAGESGRINRYAPDGSPLDGWRLDSGLLTTRPGPWLFVEGIDSILVTIRAGGGELALARIVGSVLEDTLLPPDAPGTLPTRRGGSYRVQKYWSWHDGFVVGISDEYSFDVHRADGVLRIEREIDPLPVRPEEADQIRVRFRWMEGNPSYQPPEGEWVPASMPPYAGLRVGADGRIWVRRNVESVPDEVDATEGGPPPVEWMQPVHYDVFEADGRYLTELRMPADFTPHLFGDGHLWGVATGQFDEQYVVRWRIEEGG